MKENKFYKLENLKIVNYDHGGARVYLGDEKKNRRIIVDIYGDKDNPIEMGLKATIIMSIKHFLENLS